jgi:hypothetical protein
MSAFGPQQTSVFALHMSAFGGKADMRCSNVRTSVVPVVGAASRFVHRAGG